MKTIITLLVTCLLFVDSHAQILGGFFSQKKENRKLLAQQIAALEVYKGYLKKGYDIASKGLNLINKIKNGDFNLHRDFFGALKIVSPRIKKYEKVTGLILLNVEAVAQLKKIGELSRTEGMAAWESQYIRQVIDHTLDLLAQTLDGLITVISDNQLQLKDDQRITRINELYQQAEEQYSFTRDFQATLQLLRVSKQKLHREVKASQQLNGVLP